MVVRSLTWPLALAALVLFAASAQACFGPKLFLGVPSDARSQVLTSLVAIYVHEKTGIETERVALNGRDVIGEIRADRVDYGFSDRRHPGVRVLLEIEGYPALVSGPRIFEELQFTTVGPALERLQQLLQAEDVARVQGEVDAGALPMAAAREFLMRKRWI